MGLNRDSNEEFTHKEQLSNSKLVIEHPELRTGCILKVKSSAFDPGTFIPRKYSAEGENISPPLTWEDVPGEAKELILICEDPDTLGSETYVHWIVYGISPDITTLAEGVKPISGAKKGINSAAISDYTGPMPPVGDEAHRYFFEVFALDTQLNLKSQCNRNELLEAMKGHVIAEGELMGLFER